MQQMIRLPDNTSLKDLEHYPLKLDKNYENLIPTGRSVRPDTTRE